MSKKDDVLNPYVDRLMEGEVVNLTREQIQGIHRDLVKAAQEDADSHHEDCDSHLETGDSLCQLMTVQDNNK